MAFTYTNTLPTNRDWVRRLLNDTNSTTYMLEDEEIDAFIAESNQSVPAAVKYLAAIAALQSLHLNWISRGRGVASKKVSHFAVVYGTGGGINVDLAVEEKIKYLRRKAAYLLSPRPYAFKVF